MKTKPRIQIRANRILAKILPILTEHAKSKRTVLLSAAALKATSGDTWAAKKSLSQTSAQDRKIAMTFTQAARNRNARLNTVSGTVRMHVTLKWDIA